MPLKIDCTRCGAWREIGGLAPQFNRRLRRRAIAANLSPSKRETGLEIMSMKFELYKDKAGEYRWRLKHSNGNILATASEGYSSRASALKCIENVKASADSEVVEV
jgi:uncharacterized protein